MGKRVGGRWRSLVGCALCAGSIVSLAGTAAAGGPLGENGEPITTSRYAIDLFQGPIYAGSRVTSLGGAYVAVAWDVDGMLQNPVAPAVRPFFSVTDFDYWLGFGLTFPGSFANMDFFNSGATSHADGSEPTVTNFVFATPSAMLQFGAFGIGANLELQSYGLGETSLGGQTSRLSTSFNIAHLQMAYAFDRGALVLGLGARILDMQVRTRATGESSYEQMRSLGTGIELGVLWKPTGKFWSLGGAFRTAIITTPSFSDAAVVNEQNDVVFDTQLGQFYLPTQAILPWDLNVGIAMELGADPLNKPWVSDQTVSQRQELRLRLRMLDRQDARAMELAAEHTPEERALIIARYDALDAQDEAEIEEAREEGYWVIQRRMAEAQTGHAMLAASALITGPSTDAVGIESFLAQEINRSGGKTVVSLRLGAEMGLIPNFMRVRAGTYLEPTRFETSDPRPHYTGGFDIRVGRWNVFGLWPDDYQWRLAVGGDLARDYFTLGVTIAGWYPRHYRTVQRPGHPE